MLKKRIVATLIVKNGIVVQSIGFKKYLPIGNPSIAIEYLNSWGIDEIILLDITATPKKCLPNYEMIRKASLNCFVPLTVGGGISELKHIKELMHCGSDKVALNHAAIYKPELIKASSEVFGCQCIVVSIDAVKTSGGYKVFDYVSKTPLPISPSEFAIKCVQLGAGEILINSVNRDGSYLGYDFELVNSICNYVSVPVIACGGAKNPKDMLDVLKNTSISAASAGNFFHFTEHSVIKTKANILNQINVRLDTYSDYRDSKFDEDYRLIKKDDKFLEKILFTRIEKEKL